MKIARIAGNFQAQVLFTIFYFLILWVVGSAIRFFSDPLNLKKKPISSNYSDWEHHLDDIVQARKQY